MIGLCFVDTDKLCIQRFDNIHFCALIDTRAEVSLIIRSVLTEKKKIINVSRSNYSRFEILGFPVNKTSKLSQDSTPGAN